MSSQATQIALPTEVSPSEIARCKSFGRSIELCAFAAGYDSNKEIQFQLDGVDKAQLSRWQNDREGILYPKLRKLMDSFGNHIPFMWMAHDLGYDLSSIRKRESELEKQVRERDERIAQLETRLSHFEEFARLVK